MLWKVDTEGRVFARSPIDDKTLTLWTTTVSSTMLDVCGDQGLRMVAARSGALDVT